MYGILNGKEKSAFNLFIDESPEKSLKYGILNRLAKGERKVVLFCYQESQQAYHEKLTRPTSLNYFDGFSDPLSWLAEKPASPTKDLKAQLINTVSQLGVRDLSSAVVFIDDLTIFGRSHGLVDIKGQWNSQMLRMLVQVSNKIPIFIYMRPELLHSANVKSFIHHASFYVKFLPRQKLISKGNTCESIFRKKSGKIHAEIFDYEVNQDGQLVLSKKKESANKDMEPSYQDADPTSNLTFNLRLTDSEREAKANIVLPYILKAENKSSMLREDVNKVIKGGEIIYTPDDLDDFDDEDPDDDLDI